MSSSHWLRTKRSSKTCYLRRRNPFMDLSLVHEEAAVSGSQMVIILMEMDLWPPHHAGIQLVVQLQKWEPRVRILDVTMGTSRKWEDSLLHHSTLWPWEKKISYHFHPFAVPSQGLLLGVDSHTGTVQKTCRKYFPVDLKALYFTCRCTSVSYCRKQ